MPEEGGGFDGNARLHYVLGHQKLPLCLLSAPPACSTLLLCWMFQRLKENQLGDLTSVVTGEPGGEGIEGTGGENGGDYWISL